MAEVISILIADDNVELGELLEKYINREMDLKVIGVAREGIEAVNKIISLTPDVVILDLIMPNLDGIGVLEKLSAGRKDLKPIIIMLSAIGQDLFIKKAISLGADYFLVKPFDAAVLVKRIRELFNGRDMAGAQLDNCNTDIDKAAASTMEYAKTEYRITELMRFAGIPPHLAGYKYLREAVMYTLANSSSICPVTKIVYPEVAKKFSTTPQIVERGIRSAIESTWKRNGFESFKSFLRTGGKKTKPTNFEFIAILVDKVRMESIG